MAFMQATQVHAGQASQTFAAARLQGKGQLTVYWNAIEPYVYRHSNGQLMGVEYELMQAFAAYVQQRYNCTLQLKWEEKKVFQQMYTSVRDADSANVCAVGYFSITAERLRQVQFSMPYMPDLNILVSSNSVPIYHHPVALLNRLGNTTGATVRGTTMETDLKQLTTLLPQVSLSYYTDDYAVLQQIATQQDKIAYVPLSIYVVGLQKGLKVRRQPLLEVKRPGFAVVLPQASDWKAPLDTFLTSKEGKAKITELVSRYLGAEVAAVVMEASLPDSLQPPSANIDLLTREREIVTARLIEAALHNQQLSITRNLIIAGLVIMLVLSVVLGAMLHSKQRLANQLVLNNAKVQRQKDALTALNQRLNQKLTVARLNPHLIFNALSSVQYFIAIQATEKAQIYVAKMAKFIRMILNNAATHQVDVVQEAEMLRQFLQLEQMRFQQAFTYQIHLPQVAVAIPSLLVFPFVEEAVYHRLLADARPAEPPMLNIFFNTMPYGLHVQISDNSMKHKQSAPLPSMEMALEQIQQMNQVYPDAIEVQQQMVPGHHKVDIYIRNNIFVSAATNL